MYLMILCAMNSKYDEWDTLLLPPSPKPKLHEFSFVTSDTNLNLTPSHKLPLMSYVNMYYLNSLKCLKLINIHIHYI